MALLLGVVVTALVAPTTRVRRRPLQAATLDSPLQWNPDGEQRWLWRAKDQDFETHYVQRFPQRDTGKAVVLVHGFGASYYHWRYNVPALVEAGYAVYALDLVGFGLSAKPNYPYSPDTWSEQIAAFVREVVGRPAALVGNSLGGYASLAAAADYPDLVTGVALLNAAGRFKSADVVSPPTDVVPGSPFDRIKDFLTLTLQRLVFAVSFELIRRPQRIEAVLRSVYPVNDNNVDADLVQSIMFPATQVDAEIYRLVVTRPGGPGRPIDDLLAKLKMPLLLAWGVQDPWIRPAAADRIATLYSSFHNTNLLRRVDLEAGHCPHDECPEATNRAITAWLDSDLEWSKNYKQL